MTDGRLWTFADFRIRDILDVDLVSTTYRATTVDGDESRRLRVFTEDIAGKAFVDLQEAVIAEARAARHVRHPHILATHDADRHDDRVYVVSDDIRGAVLRDYIADHEPLKPATALAMGWQLAEALDAVHARGIVHGAINPHTIWVADSPGRDVPMIYLTGFGSARVLARHVINQNGAPTSDDLLYVGPDQIRDERGNPEADRYALACAVYHLLTGVPPFRRGSINALLGAHLFSAVEPPSAMRDDLPAALDSVFARALAKDTSDRYPSASALMIAVERGLGGQEDAGPLARRRRSNRRNCSGATYSRSSTTVSCLRSRFSRSSSSAPTP
jgi:serine/threonine protein kinase